MTVHIRLVGPASGPIMLDGPPIWLAVYDIEADNGRGRIVTTHDRSLALPFPNFAAAMDCVRSVPICHPLRSDGKANRPLTAYHVELLAADVEPT